MTSLFFLNLMPPKEGIMTSQTAGRSSKTKQSRSLKPRNEDKLYSLPLEESSPRQSQALKPSNENKLYNLPIKEGPPYPPKCRHPPPPRRKLQVYSRKTHPPSRLKYVATFASSQAERESSEEESEEDNSSASRDELHLASPSSAQPHEESDDEGDDERDEERDEEVEESEGDEDDDEMLSTAQAKFVRGPPPDPAERKRIREQAMKYTPVAKRNERRRLQTKPVLSPREESYVDKDDEGDEMLLSAKPRPPMPETAERMRIREEAMKFTPVAKRNERRRIQTKLALDSVTKALQENIQAANTKPQLDAMARAEIRLEAMKYTPHSARMDRRRQKSKEQEAIAKANGDAAVGNLHHDTHPSAELSAVRHMTDDMLADQNDGSQDSNVTDASLTIEEQIRKAQQNHFHGSKERVQEAVATGADTGEKPGVALHQVSATGLFHDFLNRAEQMNTSQPKFKYVFKDSESQSSGSDSVDNTGQRLQSVVGSEPKRDASSVGMSRHGRPSTCQEAYDSPEPQVCQGSNAQ
jgi:hypothetical protein